jgi:hypothetical protein
MVKRRFFTIAGYSLIRGSPVLVAAKVNKKNQKASFLYNFAQILFRNTIK